jgi:hypothetical protein
MNLGVWLALPEGVNGGRGIVLALLRVGAEVHSIWFCESPTLERSTVFVRLAKPNKQLCTWGVFIKAT